MYGSLIYPQGPYPGYDELGDISDSDCLDRFANYVGVDYDSSQLIYGPLWATEPDWDAGDRAAVCILYDMDLAPLTGSVYHTGY